MTRLTAVGLVIMLAGVSGCGPSVQGADRRTQLERLAGISPSDAGRFSNGQLTAIFHIENDSGLNDNTRDRRIRSIKARGRR